MSPILSAIVIIFALVALILVLIRPYWAALMIILLFPIEQLLQSYFPFFQVNARLFNYLVAGIAVLAVSQRLLKRDAVIADLNNPAGWLIYGQFGLWMAAMMYTTEVATDAISLQTNAPYLMLRLILLPLLILNLEECRRVLMGMMLVGTTMALLILLNPNTSYYTGRLVLDLGMIATADSAVGNPLATAEMGGMIALIAALFSSNSKRPLLTMLRVSAFVLGLGLAVGSGSRGQVLAAIVAGVLFYPVARRLNNPRNFFLTAFGLMMLAGGLYVVLQLFIGDQNRERWDLIQMIKDITLRFDMAFAYFQAWVSSPAHWLFGLGTNAWLGIGAAQFNADYVHNVFVEILCEQGLVGATVCMAAMYLTIRMGMRMWWIHRDDPALRSTTAILLALCAFSLFNAIKQGSLASGFPFVWWLLLTKLATHEIRQPRPEALTELENEWAEPLEEHNTHQPAYAATHRFE